MQPAWWCVCCPRSAEIVNFGGAVREPSRAVRRARNGFVSNHVQAATWPSVFVVPQITRRGNTITRYLSSHVVLVCG